MTPDTSIPTAIQKLASEYGVSATVPELESDIDAQIRALLDPDHPKHSVFLARDNGLGARQLPEWIFVEQRAEGMLLTDSATIAAAFRDADMLNDTMLAAILGYPEAKSTLIGRPDVCAVQALDKDGNVVFEALASVPRLIETLEAADLQVPYGGRRIVVSVDAAITRRQRRMN